MVWFNLIISLLPHRSRAEQGVTELRKSSFPSQDVTIITERLSLCAARELSFLLVEINRYMFLLRIIIRLFCPYVLSILLVANVYFPLHLLSWVVFYPYRVKLIIGAILTSAFWCVLDRKQPLFNLQPGDKRFLIYRNRRDALFDASRSKNSLFKKVLHCFCVTLP